MKGFIRSFKAALVKHRKQGLGEKEVYKEALPNGFQSWFWFYLRLAVLALEFYEIPLHPQTNASFEKKKKKN